MNDNSQNRTSGIIGRFAVLGAVLIVAGVFVSTLTVNHEDQCIRRKIIFRAEMAAEAVNLNRLRNLTGTSSDETNPDYLLLKEQLEIISYEYPEWKYVSLQGMRDDGEIFAYVENRGRGYENSSAERCGSGENQKILERVFREKKAVNSEADEGGHGGLCIMVPLVDAETDATVAVTVISASMAGWSHVRLGALLEPILILVVVLALLVAGAGVLSRSRRVAEAKQYRTRFYENAIAIVVVGLFLSMVAAMGAREWEVDKRETAFEHLACDKTAAVAHSLKSIHDIELEALGRFFEASEYVSIDEFHEYTNYLLRNTVVNSWKWVSSVPAGDRAMFETEIREHGLRDFEIWGRDPIPRHIEEREDAPDVYYPVMRVAPLPGNESSLGFDMGSDPVYLDTLGKIARTGLPSCTPPFFSGNGPGDGWRILIFRPSFNGDDGKLKGFAAAEVNLYDLISSVQSDGSVILEIGMVEGNNGAPPSIISLEPGSRHNDEIGLSLVRPVFAFGEAFLVRGYAGQEFLRTHPVLMGWLVVFAGVMFSITVVVILSLIQRKRWELEGLVAEAENQAELAIQGANLGAWDLDIKKGTVKINDRCALMLGLDQDNLTFPVEEWRARVFSEDMLEIQERMNKHIVGETGFMESEHRMRHRDGSYIWLLSRGRILERDKSGNPVRVCGTFLDITGRKTMEAELQKNRAQLRTLVDTLPDLVWLKDPNGLYISCNRKFERFFGASESEIMGKTDYDFVGRELADFFRENDKAAMEAGGPLMNEEKVTYADDGHRELLETIKTPMFDSEGNLVGVLGIARDITDRRKTEEEKEKLSSQLLHSQKMEAIGILAGGVAHDFNNLLAIIMGSAQLAKLDADENSDIDNELSVILDSSRRAKDLTMKLLTFARKDKSHKSANRVKTIIDEVVGIIGRSLSKHIHIKSIIKDDVQIMCDANQLHQVLMNLCTNAADAMQAGGDLTIECSEARFDENRCETCGKVLGDRYCLIKVSDTGIGMKEEMISKVTDPFFTTKGVGKGTGLGLSVTHGIIESHDGHMHIYSEYRKGTCVKIYLPMSDTGGSGKIFEKKEKAITGNETILVIDDEQQLLEMAGRYLRKNGYDTLLAQDGRGGIETFRRNKDRIAVVVLDLMMPDVDGPDVFREMKDIKPDVKVVFASGYSINSQARRLLGEDNHRFVQKPFDVTELCATIREVIDSTR